MAADWNGSTGLASTRYCTAADVGAPASSTIRAVTVTESVDRGTTGVCVTSLISGAALLLRAELAAPGVPRPVLDAQFCPESLVRAGLTSSSDGPPPSAAWTHFQPTCP